HDVTQTAANTAVSLAYNQYTFFSPWAEEEKANKLPWGTPNAIGVGVDVGAAIRLTFENGSHDYLGTPVNIAAKMQNLARPNGGVVIQEKVWSLIGDTKENFPKEGKLRVGKKHIPVRATGEVELRG